MCPPARSDPAFASFRPRSPPPGTDEVRQPASSPSVHDVQRQTSRQASAHRPDRPVDPRPMKPLAPMLPRSSPALPTSAAHTPPSCRRLRGKVGVNHRRVRRATVSMTTAVTGHSAARPRSRRDRSHWADPDDVEPATLSWLTCSTTVDCTPAAALQTSAGHAETTSCPDEDRPTHQVALMSSELGGDTFTRRSPPQINGRDKCLTQCGDVFGGLKPHRSRQTCLQRVIIT